MTITGRAALLALAGILAVLVAPVNGAMVGYVALALTLLVLVDVVAAASPRSIGLAHEGATSTRLGEEAEVHLVVVNTGRRVARTTVRDCWPPSAGARPRAQRVVLAPGDRTVLTTTLTPTRRGERAA